MEGISGPGLGSTLSSYPGLFFHLVSKSGLGFSLVYPVLEAGKVSLKAHEMFVTGLVPVGMKLSFTCVSGVGLRRGRVSTGECPSSYTSKKTAKLGTKPREYHWHTKQQDIEDCVT